MANLLKSYYKTQLILVANSYADANGLERPDRVTHRNKNAMVCWFVLNAPDFPLGFPPIPTGNRRSVPAAASVVPAAATAAAPAQTNNTDWNLDEGWHLDESWNLDEGWNFDEGWNLDESWTLNNADTTD
jgi:hypothetical protein